MMRYLKKHVCIWEFSEIIWKKKTWNLIKYNKKCTREKLATSREICAIIFKYKYHFFFILLDNILYLDCTIVHENNMRCWSSSNTQNTERLILFLFFVVLFLETWKREKWCNWLNCLCFWWNDSSLKKLKSKNEN